MTHYLPEAGVNGTDEDTEGLPGAAPHGTKHFAKEGDETEPAFHIILLHLLPHHEVFLQKTKRRTSDGRPPEHKYKSCEEAQQWRAKTAVKG